MKDHQWLFYTEVLCTSQGEGKEGLAKVLTMGARRVPTTHKSHSLVPLHLAIAHWEYRPASSL